LDRRVALLRCDFFSDVLGLSTSMTVILPQRTSAQIGMSGAARGPDAGHPVLYLLHGLSDDCTTWVRRTSIERYAAPLGLAVVMPQVQRSFYTDEVHGNRFRTFLTDELPGVVGEFFRVSARREDTFVAGLSMGGYGALTWALTRPERFAMAASLSGALDLDRLRRTGSRSDVLATAFGDRPLRGTPDDPTWLLQQADPAVLPRLYVCCGTDDPLVPDNRAFAEACVAHGVVVDADFGPGGHDWAYWDARIQDVLERLPLNDVTG
jgi:putative tributyrin esterase